MFTIIYMRADYEPWWQFDDWEEHIVSKSSFKTRAQQQVVLQEMLRQMRERFTHEASKDGYYAFWNEDEIDYCDACEDDAQIYHGIFTRDE